MSRARVVLEPGGGSAEAAAGETILEAALRAGLPIFHACGGQGLCSTCRVAVMEGDEVCGEQLEARTPVESRMAERLVFPPAIRLACQARVRGDVVVRRLVLDEEDADLASRSQETATGPVGVEREVAVLFVDIRGFTRFTERQSPYDVVHILRRYFRRMDEVVRGQGGTIDVTMGDGFMALFGLESPAGGADEDPAVQAVKAGLLAVAEAERLADYIEPVFGWRLRVGAGVHVGRVVTGVVWPPERRRPTVIGDAVNLASRIESATKTVGVPLLVSGDVAARLGPGFRVTERCETDVPGRSGRVTLFEVVPAG